MGQTRAILCGYYGKGNGGDEALLASLRWLVTLQAAMTVLGNITLCAAAWWIWQSARKPERKSSTKTAGENP